LDRIEAALSAIASNRAASPPRETNSAPAVAQAAVRSSAAIDETRLVVADDQSKSFESHEAEVENVRREEQQLISLLDNTVMTEQADPSWSIAAAEEIGRDLPPAALEKTQLGDVRCQSTLCRIQATHDNPNVEQSFMAELGRLTSFRNGEAFLTRTPREDGRLVTTVFVSRSGHSLPALR
jgi:hypothetical protein